VFSFRKGVFLRSIKPALERMQLSRGGGESQLRTDAPGSKTGGYEFFEPETCLIACVAELIERRQYHQFLYALSPLCLAMRSQRDSTAKVDHTKIVGSEQLDDGIVNTLVLSAALESACGLHFREAVDLSSCYGRVATSCLALAAHFPRRAIINKLSRHT
jgi:hypothetical protein